MVGGSTTSYYILVKNISDITTEVSAGLVAMGNSIGATINIPDSGGTATAMGIYDSIQLLRQCVIGISAKAQASGLSDVVDRCNNMLQDLNIVSNLYTPTGVGVNNIQNIMDELKNRITNYLQDPSHYNHDVVKTDTDLSNMINGYLNQFSQMQNA
jgi:hypothetical protein